MNLLTIVEMDKLQAHRLKIDVIPLYFCRIGAKNLKAAQTAISANYTILRTSEKVTDIFLKTQIFAAKNCTNEFEAFERCDCYWELFSR